MKLTLNQLAIPEGLRAMAANYVREKYLSEVAWGDRNEQGIFVLAMDNDSIHSEEIGIAMIEGINQDLQRLVRNG